MFRKGSFVWLGGGGNLPSPDPPPRLAAKLDQLALISGAILVEVGVWEIENRSLIDFRAVLKKIAPLKKGQVPKFLGTCPKGRKYLGEGKPLPQTPTPFPESVVFSGCGGRFFVGPTHNRPTFSAFATQGCKFHVFAPTRGGDTPPPEPPPQTQIQFLGEGTTPPRPPPP